MKVYRAKVRQIQAYEDKMEMNYWYWCLGWGGGGEWGQVCEVSCDSFRETEFYFTTVGMIITKREIYRKSESRSWWYSHNFCSLCKMNTRVSFFFNQCVDFFTVESSTFTSKHWRTHQKHFPFLKRSSKAAKFMLSTPQALFVLSVLSYAHKLTPSLAWRLLVWSPSCSTERFSQPNTINWRMWTRTSHKAQHAVCASKQ